MGAQSKRAKVQRKAEEFSIVRLAESLKVPADTSGIYAWLHDQIRVARSEQLRGHFRLPFELATAARTDDAIYTASRNRLAPIAGLPVTVLAASSSARAERIAFEAEALFGPKGIAITKATCKTLHSQLADHGVAFGVNVWTPREDGSRVDVELRPWPIRHVRWDPIESTFVTMTRSGGTEKICHGDGRWTVFASEDIEPWRNGAMVPIPLVWSDRATGVRDRSRASTSHGNAKMVGELPEGIAINSDEGRAFLLLLKTMHDALPYGIRPAGSKTDMIVNTSTAWQVFKEIVDTRLSDAARVYLGHDGGIKAAGGNYVKDGYLYGVSLDIVEDDVGTLERGFFEGVIQPWTAVNFGVSDLAPWRKWSVPDADEEVAAEISRKKWAAFNETVAALKGNGFVLDDAQVGTLATTFGLQAPRLPAATAVQAPGTRATTPPADPRSTPAPLRALPSPT